MTRKFSLSIVDNLVFVIIDKDFVICSLFS